MAKENDQKKTNGSALDFEAQLWVAADKMRGLSCRATKMVWMTSHACDQSVLLPPPSRNPMFLFGRGHDEE